VLSIVAALLCNVCNRDLDDSASLVNMSNRDLDDSNVAIESSGVAIDDSGPAIEKRVGHSRGMTFRSGCVPRGT
jgi:hypothetical protein